MTQQDIQTAEIGIIGGSGFYEFIENGEEFEIDTDWGKPSAKITVGEVEGKKVAFLPRHGKKHIFPPHRVPYLANIAALKKIGVKYIIAPSSCGSLQANIKPGDFIICDQFVDRTKNRPDTYYNGPEVVHIVGAEPYCPTLRQIAIASCEKLNIAHHPAGTAVVVNGPRFSTKAESLWFTKMGWQVVNMTQYPEVVLAREQDIHYVNISLSTDYDVGIVAEQEMPPVNIEEVLKTFKNNIEKVKNLIKEIIKQLPPEELKCECHRTLEKSKL
ncbi:S-methyl-5'-thioadenosine phosphorylase [Patescibacteria group bacterium]|nr:S-methyl-5'-thioadenosine phosphorylase [Patescibacteria group bacterium]